MDASSYEAPEPVGLIHLDTRLLQTFAAAESPFRNSRPLFNQGRQWDGPEDSLPLASAKLIQGLGLKCQSLERKAVCLGSCY